MTTPSTEYRLIPLSQGQSSKVPAHRYEEVMQWKWFARWNAKTKSFYAMRTDYPNGWRKPSRTILLHRYLLGLSYGDKRQGEHKNHDTLDNTEANLRIATNQQNQWNKSRQSHNRSGYKGVFLEKGREKYIAAINLNGRPRKIGRFPFTQEGLIAAARAYDTAAKLHFGEFAHINFPEEESNEPILP